MKIHCVGGGPAGLYFGVLAKTAEPGHDITVFERNRPHDSEGWGLAFSDRTWRRFEAIDPETCAPLDREMVRWDAVEVRARGERVRSRGHPFRAIARERFDGILRQRAGELGVRLRFETPIEDPEPLRDCDLLVCADGASSICRLRWEQELGTARERGTTRFIWLGTRAPFDAFTFGFRQSIHGSFHAHAFPFSRALRAFVVECHEATWRRAGLSAAGEAYTAAYCEELFADELGGHRLLSNRSAWPRSETVRNARWHHGNVVLVGDAAHTTHFSAGTGARLALEDAAALARALREEDDLAAALSAYEAVRRPRVERSLEAAAWSRRWFETVDQRSTMAPRQLAFSLMTRTPRTDRDILRERDPDYVRETERWFAAAHGAAPTTPPRHVPIDIRGIRFPGRVARTVSEEGTPAPDTAALWLVPFHGSREQALGHVHRLRTAGALVGARIDRTGSLAGSALLDAIRDAAWAGCDGLELWMDPRGDLGPQTELLRMVRRTWEGILVARWETGDAVSVARDLARAELVDALHVPAASAEALRQATGLPTIAIALGASESDVDTALLAGRADLVERT